MHQLRWIQASGALCGAIGLPVQPGSLKKPEELASFLQGCGMHARRVALVNHIIPANDKMVGALLETEDGGFIPVLGNALDAAILNEDGEAVCPLEIETIVPVRYVWLIEEYVPALTSTLPFLTRHKGRFAELLLSALVINLFALVLPIFSSFVYDKILGNDITDTLWALVIGLCIIVGVEFCVRIIRIAVAERFAVSSEVDIDHSTFANLLDASANKMPSVGILLEKYKQVLSFRDFLSSSYLLAFADIPFLFLFLATIAIVAGPLVFVAITCGTCMLLASLFFTAPVLAYDHQAKIAGERRFGLMTDVLVAREAVIGGALRGELSRRWGQSSVASAVASSKARYWRGFGLTIVNSISYLSYMAVLVGGVYMVEDHTLTSGGLLAASMLTSRSMAGVSSIITLVIRFREFRIALRELNQAVPSVKRPAYKSHGRLNGEVRLDKIICRLQEGAAPVLNGISMTIAPREIVGIAGAPGAGKTTLLRLIAGVLQPDEGRVYIDNIPLSRLSHNDVSSNVGYKPQEFCLLDGTVEENVRAGRPPLSATQRHDILHASGLSFAFQENGLNWTTNIGPRGANISGGQRQLISLARAMLYAPTLLLLDEPTNGLDAALEAHLGRQILLMKGQCTMLISTHSRNILSVCDRIVVVGRSHILADGPKEKILA